MSRTSRRATSSSITHCFRYVSFSGRNVIEIQLPASSKARLRWLNHPSPQNGPEGTGSSNRTCRILPLAYDMLGQSHPLATRTHHHHRRRRAYTLARTGPECDPVNLGFGLVEWGGPKTHPGHVYALKRGEVEETSIVGPSNRNSLADCVILTPTIACWGCSKHFTRAIPRHRSRLEEMWLSSHMDTMRVFFRRSVGRVRIQFDTIYVPVCEGKGMA